MTQRERRYNGGRTVNEPTADELEAIARNLEEPDAPETSEAQPARRTRKPRAERIESSPGVSTRVSAKDTGWSEHDIEALVFLFSGALVFGTARVAEHTTPEARAEADEANAIAAAFARIVARHIVIKAAKKGDVGDVLEIAAGILAYSIRVMDVRSERIKDETAVIQRPGQAFDADEHRNGNNQNPDYLTWDVNAAARILEERERQDGF